MVFVVAFRDPLSDAPKSIGGYHYSAGMTYGLFGKFLA